MVLVCCMAGTTVSFAQGNPATSAKDTANYPYWIRMMQDPDANYFSTVSAFNKYWQNRKITKGCGWKVFKRWEYIMRGRIAPDGKKQTSGHVFSEWEAISKGNRSSNGNWVSNGPATIPAPGPAGYYGLGRLNVIAFHPVNPDKIFTGSPSGGFWLTNDHGANWSTTTDNLPTIGVSAIVVDYSNPDKILMGTGDRDHGDAPGMGVFKSTDGGLTWVTSKTGMSDVTVCKLIQHPGNALIFLAATTGGIYRSVNGGSNWTLTASGDFKDICFKPDYPDIVYAESSSDFFRSANNGLSFIQITSGLTSGQRAAIAVSAANPNYVYFLQSDNSSGYKGVYRSVDAGLNFSTRSESPNILDWSCSGNETGGQGWYDLVIVADPNNAEVVYVGGVNVWKSADGGASWTINSHWYGGCSVPAVHADCHFLGFSPVNGRLYAGNDGGIYYADHDGKNWTDMTVGMTIGQIYKIGQSQTDGAKTINGFQDNGTYTLTSSGWVATGGGDGMECAVDFQNAAYTYHTIYYGSIYRKINNSNEAQIAGDGVYGINESGDWVTPFMLSETDPKKMFVGYKNVWRCSDVTAGSPSWVKISSGETQNCYVLEQSPANIGIVYAVRWSNLQRTDNANDPSPDWVTCTLPGGYTPTDLEAHPTDPDIVYATAGNKVYKSINKGNSWSMVSGILPDIPINTIVYDKNSSEGLYIGTQTGVFYKNSTMNNWVIYNTGLPVVDVRELEIFYSANPVNNRLVAATYGRGLWRTVLYSPPNSPPIANFSYNPVSPCPGDPVQLTDLSLNAPTSWMWSFTPDDVTFLNSTNSHSQNPVIQFNQSRGYTVSLAVTNTHGSSVADTLVSVGGNPAPFSESFEHEFFPEGWSIVNPDADFTWSIANIGGNGSSSKAAFIDFYDYGSQGQLDDMITPSASLSGMLHPWLKFKVAYRRWGDLNSDGLKIFVSTDCGNTWEIKPVYDKSGLVLATGPDQQDPFFPSVSSDWRLDSIDLTSYTDGPVKLKLQAENGFGNNLYVDDISIAELPVLIISDINVPSGQNICFNATETIRVAGAGKLFSVKNGGHAIFIAGRNIIFYDGTSVNQNGYLHGYITTNGQYCGVAFAPIAAVLKEQDPPTTDQQSFFKAYPNPTNGKLTLELTGVDPTIPVYIEIYTSRGEKIISSDMAGRLKYDFSLAERPAGLYFIRLVSREYSGAQKIIKR